MDAAQFLSRVVPSGNYVAIAYKPPDKQGMRHRFFPRDNLGDAAGFIRWCARKGMDVWFAVASYRLATPRGETFEGHRTQENAQMLRSFWVDLDVKRAGDGKQIDKVFADVPAAMVWFRTFLNNVKLPPPNLWVRSGYGLHVYWVLEDELATQDWKPYAEGLKSAMLSSNGAVDVSITIDSARILRPPETYNFKDPAHPAPVEVLSKYSRGDYPNQLIYQALQPYVGIQTQRAVNYGSGGSTILGTPPVVLATHRSINNAAAQANIPTYKRDYYFAEIAKKCEQVKLSLATHGLGDTNRLWDMGFLSLAHFCVDGSQFIHPISDGDPRYNQAQTDRIFAQISADIVRKNVGAPLCPSFNAMRPGVCNTCPHNGKVSSPYTLGTPDGDLPDGYKRIGNKILLETIDKSGAPRFDTVLTGNVHSPILDKIGDDRKLTFTYKRAGAESTVSTMQSKVPVNAEQAMHFFGPQGLTLYKHNADLVGAFVVAWIEKLRDAQAERPEIVPAFGWATNASAYEGFSAGGVIHYPNGATGPAPGGDPELLGMYRPRGTLAAWQHACDFVTNNRIDLQVLVAVAFASPLIEFTGQQGVVCSAWSRDSAVGKSSAMQVGMSVWGDIKAMFSFDDTVNSIHYRIGKTKVMPAYWDEIRINQTTAEAFVDTLFKLGQGKDKSRLNSDASLKATGDWKTMLMVSGNRKLMDFIVHVRGDTDAGAVRLFEFQIDRPKLPFDALAPVIIAEAGKNAGNAGAVYAAWLGQNVSTARDMIAAAQTKLKTMLSATQDERFYIAAISTLLVGAQIANSLKLTKFDVGGMRDFLCAAFIALRSDRKSTLVVQSGTFDVERILADFISAHSADRLRTNYFMKAGGRAYDSNFRVLWAPRRIQCELAIHISKTENHIRIAKRVFDEWCYKNNISSSDVHNQFKARWGALYKRGLLGAGTDFVTGSVPYIDISLNPPELAQYNEGNDR